MNRIGSLVFATATTALTGAAVVMAAGGTIFGLEKITPSGGQQQAAESVAGPLVRASFLQELPAETAVAAVETEIPFAAGGWSQGATGGESEAIAPEAPAPQPTGFAERGTPPPASTPAPSTPTSAPAAKVAPPPTSTPELSEPPSFVMPPNEPTASAKSPAAPPAAAAQSPTSPPAAQAPSSPSAAPSSTPSAWMDDDDDEDEHDEDEHEDEHEEEDDD